MSSSKGKVTVRKAREFMEELILVRTENRIGTVEFDHSSLGGDLPCLEGFR